MLGDLNIAEPKALIGFAGPRVIEQTIRQKLPEGFQRCEFLLEKGMLDLVVDRREMKAVIASALRFMGAKPTGAAAAAGRRPRAEPAARTRRRPLTRLSDADPLDYLFGLEQFGIKFGLDNIRALVDALGHPERAFRSRARRRHQRQGLGHGDGRRGAARGRPSHRPLHLAPSGRSRPSASSIDGQPVDRGDARARPSPTCATSSTRCCAAARSQAQPTFFEVTTAVGVRAVPPGRRRRRGLRGRARRPARRDQRPRAGGHGHHLDRLRSSAVPRAHAARDRRREGRHHQARRPGRRRPAWRRKRAQASWNDALARRAADRCADDRSRHGRGRRSHVRLRTPVRDYGDVRSAWRAHQVDNALVAVRMLETLDGSGIAVPPAAIVARRSNSVAGRAGSICADCRTAAKCCSTRRTTRRARRRSRAYLAARRRPRRWSSRRCATRTCGRCCARSRRSSARSC